MKQSQNFYLGAGEFEPLALPLRFKCSCDNVCMSKCLTVRLCLAPAPNNVQLLTSNHCRDRQHSHDAWFYTRPRGGNCERIPALENLYRGLLEDDDVDDDDTRRDSTPATALTANDIVFVFQFPNPRDGRELTMSRLHQTMLSVFTLSINFDQSYSGGKLRSYCNRHYCSVVSASVR